MISKIKGSINYVYMLITAILFTIVFICLTILNFTNDFYEASINNVSSRTLLVPSDVDTNLLKENEHIIFVAKDKYRFGANFFYNEDNYIYIRAITDKSYLKIVNGKYLSSNGDMICSKRLYPYEYSSTMDFTKTIDSSKLIGTSITDGNNTFKIVGTYKNIEMEEINSCYVSIEDFDKLDVEEYDQIMVIVDEAKNYEDVINFLNDNNISYINPITTDSSYYYLRSISMFVMCIVIILVLYISYMFIKKTINNSNKTIGILKTSGLNNKNMCITYNIYFIVMTLISILVSILLSVIIYLIVNPHLTEAYFYSLYINIPVIFIVLFLLIYIIYSLLIVRLIINKKNKQDINVLK